MKNKKTLVIIALLVLVVALIGIGGTFAFFTSSDDSATQTFTTGTLKVEYKAGSNINASGMYPVLETGASLHEFTIKNTGSISAKYSISFIDFSLKDKDNNNTTSNNLKWKLYEATVADDVYTISNPTPVAEGTFGSSSGFQTDTTTKEIINNQTIAGNNATASYVLKVWLNETGSPQNDDQGIKLSTKLRVYAEQQ